MTKELLFSVTKNDFDWSYTRGTGKGGQKRNKTDSAVHCMHRPSGAAGYSEAGRSQSENKIDAFRKCVATDKFQKWIKLETARRSGQLATVEEAVEKAMNDRYIRTEIKDKGKWVETTEIKEDVDND